MWLTSSTVRKWTHGVFMPLPKNLLGANYAKKVSVSGLELCALVKRKIMFDFGTSFQNGRLWFSW